MSKAKGKGTQSDKATKARPASGTKSATGSKSSAAAKSASATKAKKSAKARKTDPVRTRIIDATLSLIAEKGWRETRVEDVIAATGISDIEFAREFGGLTSVIVAASRTVNAHMLEEKADFAADESTRDRLFSLLMARFDAARPWAPAIKELAHSAPRDPVLAATGVKVMMMASDQALSAAGIRTRGPLGFARVNAFAAGVMTPVSRVWVSDHSPDLDKTTVALDRALDRAEWVASRLKPACRERKISGSSDAEEPQDA